MEKTKVNFDTSLLESGLDSPLLKDKENTVSKSGPSYQSESPLIDCLCGEVGIGETCEVEGRSAFGTAGSPSAAVSEGDWYYEVEILQIPEAEKSSGGVVQIGIGTDLFIPDQNTNDGVGDKPFSWGFDPLRGILFTQGNERNLDVHRKIKVGDIIGCLLHLGENSKG